MTNNRGQRRADLDHEHHRVLGHIRGFSLTNDSLIARFTISGSNRGRAAGAFGNELRAFPLISGLSLCGGAVSVTPYKTPFHSAFGNARQSALAKEPGNK